ncbi:MAG: heparinase II/III family protein [Kiritimatiellae bacterium]|nr:heparinase II/III family protein [Kiritimatiellia bacterium]
MAAASAAEVAFPTERPEGACFPRPAEDELLEISPPGFCWWPAGPRGRVRYRLRITDSRGAAVYESPALSEPVHVPSVVLAPGPYRWEVQALDAKGYVLAVRAPQTFVIASNAVAQPWVPASVLLARVPRERPRLLFPRAQLEAVRATLATTRREAFASLRGAADSALNLKPPSEPDYDKLSDPAARRLAYVEAFRRMRRYHDEGMTALALMYLLSGERRYGEAAKALLLGATEWDPEGISSVSSPYGDEIGLGLAKSAAQAFDWLYDLLDGAERERVRQMLVARADQMLRRLERWDFLARPEESHNGRLPGYLMEHAIALAEEPRAEAWLDYALRAALTVFPHWAGADGGWAEGIAYGLAYNTIYLLPFESLRAATGFDLWQRPFYRDVRRFFMYNVSPLGEVQPWGDGEEGQVPQGAAGVRALIQFHALKYRDPAARGWVTLLRDHRGRPPGVGWQAGLVLPDDLEPLPPTNLPPDGVWWGIGWAVFHSDLARPERDLMVMFKSSPYGSVSHSHADQNSFVIMKGGRALAIPAGYYFPFYGAPHHAHYTRQTVAHNCVLVNGRGQVVRDARANGRLVEFRSRPGWGYVLGDASAAYRGALRRFRRHLLLVRPAWVVVLDELEADQPAEFQWLLHAKERMELDEGSQTVVGRRGEAQMWVRLFTAGGFRFEQTDGWPVPPSADYPAVAPREPPRQWHFTATTRQKTTSRRIAAVIAVDANAAVDWDRAGPDVRIEATEGDVQLTLTLHLSPEAATLIEGGIRGKSGGPVESIRVP